MARNKTFAALRTQNPGLYKFSLKALEMERKEIFKQLAMLGETRNFQTKRKLQRKMWVINGVLCHDLDEKLLNQIADKFAKIDMVPSSYFQPELY